MNLKQQRGREVTTTIIFCKKIAQQKSKVRTEKHNLYVCIFSPMLRVQGKIWGCGLLITVPQICRGTAENRQTSSPHSFPVSAYATVPGFKEIGDTRTRITEKLQMQHDNCDFSHQSLSANIRALIQQLKKFNKISTSYNECKIFGVAQISVDRFKVQINLTLAQIQLLSNTFH